MLSQPWTKIFLKTSEPRAAKWISDAIGEQDREWLRESRTSGAFFTSPANRETKTYAVEKRTIPLVLPAEVSGLPALHGFLKRIRISSGWTMNFKRGGLSIRCRIIGIML